MCGFHAFQTLAPPSPPQTKSIRIAQERVDKDDLLLSIQSKEDYQHARAAAVADAVVNEVSCRAWGEVRVLCFFLIRWSHSMNLTRAQGISKHKIGFGRGERTGVFTLLVHASVFPPTPTPHTPHPTPHTPHHTPPCQRPCCPFCPRCRRRRWQRLQRRRRG